MEAARRFDSSLDGGEVELEGGVAGHLSLEAFWPQCGQSWPSSVRQPTNSGANVLPL